jgi:hypothetical protein
MRETAAAASRVLIAAKPRNADNLLRHRMLEAEALEAPTESLERGNGGD